MIHADLFRDNVLFRRRPRAATRSAASSISISPASTCLIYDVAITVNDWCIDADCSLDPAARHGAAGGIRAGAAFHRSRNATRGR